jgi:hypothetical protein
MKTAFRFWGITLFITLLLLLCLAKPLPHSKLRAQHIQAINSLAAPFPPLPAVPMTTNMYEYGTNPAP